MDRIWVTVSVASQPDQQMSSETDTALKLTSCAIGTCLLYIDEINNRDANVGRALLGCYRRGCTRDRAGNNTSGTRSGLGIWKEGGASTRRGLLMAGR